MAGPPLPEGTIDTLGLFDALLGYPDQLREADAAGPVAGLPAVTGLDHVVVVGAGAATSAAEIVAAVARPVSPVPVLLHRAGGRMPGFVSTRSLVVVASVDDDPVALDALADAAGLGAPTVVVGPDTGELATSGRSKGSALLATAIDVPVARAATGGLAVHVLKVLEQLGSFGEVVPMVGAAVAQLERRRDELTGERSPAARLARRIGRTLPLVHAGDDLGGVAAHHWKRRINLDAKTASFAAALPGLGWADVAGWGQHGDMTRQVFSLVTLRHDHEAAGVAERMGVLDDMLDEVVHDRHEVVAQGDGPLAQLLDLVFYGDVTAWHLAQELEIDPGPTAAVTTVWSKP